MKAIPFTTSECVYTIEITISIVIKNAFLELTTIERMATIEMVVLSNECEKKRACGWFCWSKQIVLFCFAFFPSNFYFGNFEFIYL